MLSLPHPFRWIADKWPLHAQGNFKWIPKESICVRIKGHPRLLLSNGCDNNCREKRSKQLGVGFFFFLQLGSWSKDVKNLTVAGARAALWFWSTQEGQLLTWESKNWLMLLWTVSKAHHIYFFQLTSEFIMTVNEGLVAKTGNRSEGGTLLVRAAVRHGSSATWLPPVPAPASPRRSLLDPEKPLLTQPWAAFPRRQPLVPNGLSVLTCRTIKLQSNAFLLCAEAGDQVPPVSLTFHLPLWRVRSWIVSGYLRVEFHSSETFKSRQGKELAWDRGHTEQPAAHRAFCHYWRHCGCYPEKMMLSKMWELPWEAMVSICLLSTP